MYRTFPFQIQFECELEYDNLIIIYRDEKLRTFAIKLERHRKGSSAGQNQFASILNYIAQVKAEATKGQLFQKSVSFQKVMIFYSNQDNHHVLAK